ncbi:hypothetical protein BDR07DRAFT_1496652 [Suillus spraguei]|nr:hypothetical protein BDR07DRAFT_1496652 [Suillus spraguei]
MHPFTSFWHLRVSQEVLARCMHPLTSFSHLRDAGSSYSLSGPPPHPSSHEHGASIDTGNVNDLFADPQDSKDVSASTSGQSFVTGQKSADTNATLEAGFVDIEQSFLELSGSTSIPVQQVINWFLKSRDGGSPGMSIQMKCYDLFKEAFPDKYKDILSIHNEVKMLSASPQKVSQRGQEFQKYYRRMFSIADGAAAKFGFETVMVICGKIALQSSGVCNAELMMTPSLVTSKLMSMVEGAFNDLPEDDDEASSKDADMIPSTEVEGCEESLQWFKKEIAKRVTDLGGKFTSDKNFPWKTMPSALAAGGLNIKGYPAHKCLMPGKSHDLMAKNNKGIGVLTYKEVAALVDAYKAGTMQVVKSPHTHNYSGPEHVETSVAQTRVKKGKNVSKARDPEHQELVMSPCPPVCPFKVIPKPIAKPQTPPPAPPKAATDEVIELTSASDGSKDIEELDTEYEDDSHGKKQKLKSGCSSRASKKCASSEIIDIEQKKEHVRSKAKPLKPPPSNASPLKGGPLSPLTVGSSSVDEDHSSGNEAAVQPVIRLWDGPSKVLPKFKVPPKPKHVTKESRAAMHHIHWKMYAVDSEEEEDAPGRMHSEATADAAMLADPKIDAAAWPVNPTPIAPVAPTTEDEFLPQDNVSRPLEVTPSVASQPESSEQPQRSNGMLQPTSSPSIPGNEENGNPQAQFINRPSSRPALLLQIDPHFEGATHYAHSPLLPHNALVPHKGPILREAPLHMHELPSHPRKPSVPLREPLLHCAPSVHSRDPSMHPCDPSMHPHDPSVHPRNPSVHPCC